MTTTTTSKTTKKKKKKKLKLLQWEIFKLILNYIIPQVPPPHSCIEYTFFYVHIVVSITRDILCSVLFM